MRGTKRAMWHSVSQDEKKALISSQIRAARALIRWTAEDLSRRSAVSLRTIRRAELAERDTSMTQANELAVRRALEAAGVEFIDDNGGGPGVRLRKAHQQAKRG
jgi:transcriptional regulator with XRE-family HTH domain